MFDYYNILLPTPLHITQAEVPCLSLCENQCCIWFISFHSPLIFSCGSCHHLFCLEQTQWTWTSQRHFYCRLVKIQGGLVGMGEVLGLNHSLTLWPWTNYLTFWNSVSCPWKLNNGARNSGVLHWFYEIKYKELYCSACYITCL